MSFLPKSRCLLISWLKSPCTDFEAQENELCLCFHFPPVYLPWSDGTGCHDLPFLNVEFSAFSLSSFTFIRRLFSSYSLFALRVVSSAYLRLLTFLPAILITTWASSNLTFCIMYSACKLNKQGDNIQPWLTPFPMWNQFILCSVLTVASWPAYRFLKRRVRWSGIPIFQNFPQLVVTHTVKGFSIVNEAEDFF